MALRQQFSTTIYSWDGTMSAEVLFLPRADMAIPESDDAQYFRSVMDTLGPEFVAPVVARNPERGLAVFLQASEGSRGVFRDFVGSARHLQESAFLQLDSLTPTHEYEDFAKELLSSSRIPIEESPLSGVPLGDLFSRASKASPLGLGALVGWLIAGNTPMLLLWVPIGIIIIRSSAGIGRGLEEGLYARIKKLFTPQRTRKR